MVLANISVRNPFIAFSVEESQESGHVVKHLPVSLMENNREQASLAVGF
jgi:hypothetical protein